MYQTVKRIIEANDTNWEGIPAFVNAFESFKSRLTELETKSHKHGVILMGVTNGKDNLRKEVIAELLPVIASLKSIAMANKDQALITRMKITVSNLKMASRISFIQLTDRVLESAEEYLSQLEAYNISIDMILALKEKRNVLYISLMSPREAILERKSLTKVIDTLVGEMNAILKNDMDQIMKVIRTVNAEFYDLYVSSRRTIESHSNNSGSTDILSNEPEGI